MLPPRKRLAHRLKAALYPTARPHAFLARHLPPALPTGLVEAPQPLLAAELASLPHDVTTIDDAIDLWDGSLGAGWYDRAAEDALLRRASALIASSELLRDELARRAGRPVELLPNGVDPRVFDARVARAVPADLRRGEPTVLYVGSLWGEWVDLDLIAAVAQALPRA